MGLPEHRRVVIGIARCEDAKLKGFESGHCMLFLIGLPEMIVEDSTLLIDFRVDCRKVWDVLVAA